MGCPLPRVLGVLSDATKLKFSNINSQLAEMLFLDISPANFTNFGAAWTEVDSGTNVNVVDGELQIAGSGTIAQNGMYHTNGLAAANGMLEYQIKISGTSTTAPFLGSFAASAALPGSNTNGCNITSSLNFYRGSAIIHSSAISTNTYYTVRFYFSTSADGTALAQCKMTIQGGAFTGEAVMAECEWATALTNPFYMAFQRTLASGTTYVKSVKWFSGYATDSPYVRYPHDAGSGKIFNNIDFTAFAMPGSVPTTNLTFKYYFGDNASPTMSAAYTFAQLKALGKISEDHRYFVLDVIAGSDGATQCYVDKPNSDTATDGIGQWADAAKVMADATNKSAAGTLPVASVRDTAAGGTLSSDKILKSNAVPGNWNDDNLGVGSENNVKDGTVYGLSQEGTLASGGSAPVMLQLVK